MRVPTLVDWLTFQQDYGWFLVAFGWVVAAVVWKRFGRGSRRLAWLPWAAGAGTAAAVIELTQLVADVREGNGNPVWRPWDLGLGFTTAVLAAGWWMTLARTGRVDWRPRTWAAGGAALLGTVAACRYGWPEIGGWFLAAAVTAAAVALGLRQGRGAWERCALASVALGEWCSTHGPLADALHFPQRFTNVSPVGPLAIAFQLAALAFAGAALRANAAVEEREAQSGEVRRLAAAMATWMVAGVVLAAGMAHWSRSNYQNSLQSRTLVSAGLIDRGLLARSLGPGFALDRIFSFRQPDGSESYAASSKLLATGLLRPLSQRLAELESDNPDLLWAAIVTLRDDWVVFFCFAPHMSTRTDCVGLYGHVTADDLAQWSRPAAVFRGPVRTQYGAVIFARAPIQGAGGRMLGWLEFAADANRWFSAQVQVRVLAFAVTALGAAVLVFNWLQRQRERQRQSARRDAAAAAAANKLKTEFLAKVSHELRTPLQSVLGYGELLRKTVAEPKAAGWLAALCQHGELMTRLVNDLIDLSAMESGSFRLAARPTDPAEVVLQSVESLRPSAKAKGLRLDCEVDAEVPKRVSIDAERLRQVATNLVSNAVKFTDSGSVSVSLASSRSGPAVTTLRLCVRDSGPGISPRDQGRLFAVFSRLANAEGREGSGLGLALSAALCREMGGTLAVESEGRTGSAFSATFEAGPASEGAPVRGGEADALLKGWRVLVVDDNSLIRELFVAFLREHGAACEAETRGLDALRRLRDGGFDAAIMDLSLPDIDGAEACRRLRASPGRSGDLRIVGVSAHGGSHERTRALEAGMDAFLTKPVPLGQLAAALAETGIQRAAGLSFATAEALRKRLLPQFTGELPRRIEELEAAIAASDWALVGSRAHYLKNSAIVVEDPALAEACSRLEEAAGAGDSTAALGCWSRCLQALGRWGPAGERDSPPNPSKATVACESPH